MFYAIQAIRRECLSLIVVMAANLSELRENLSKARSWDEVPGLLLPLSDLEKQRLRRLVAKIPQCKNHIKMLEAFHEHPLALEFPIGLSVEQLDTGDRGKITEWFASSDKLYIKFFIDDPPNETHDYQRPERLKRLGLAPEAEGGAE